MAELIRKEMSLYDKKINEIEIKFGPHRKGDIPHSKHLLIKQQLNIILNLILQRV